MEGSNIACVYGAKDPDQVERELDTIWDVLKDNPDILRKAGVDPDIVGEEANPFSASRTADGTGIVEAILIAAGGRLAGEILVRLWDRVIWPRLQTKIPDISQEPPND